MDLAAERLKGPNNPLRELYRNEKDEKENGKEPLPEYVTNDSFGASAHLREETGVSSADFSVTAKVLRLKKRFFAGTLKFIWAPGRPHLVDVLTKYFSQRNVKAGPYSSWAGSGVLRLSQTKSAESTEPGNPKQGPVSETRPLKRGRLPSDHEFDWKTSINQMDQKTGEIGRELEWNWGETEAGEREHKKSPAVLGHGFRNIFAE